MIATIDWRVAVVAPALLGGCSSGTQSAREKVTNESAVAVLPNPSPASLDTMIAFTPTSTRSPIVPAATPIADASKAPVAPPAPGTLNGLPDDRTPISEKPFAPDSAQGAANVVQTYFALIGEHRYAGAYRLWGDGGKASGADAAAFAASWAKYRHYNVQVGAPGRIDAGAGQRYVEVPVVAYGRLANGKPFHWKGSVTLHRTGDIDGATQAQRSWHISASNLTPIR